MTLSIGGTKRLKVRLKIVFETAWRVGSGREGEAGSDLGVMRDHEGRPVLPGSSLKGKLRATCERLAGHLGLKACLLDHSASGIQCPSDVRDRELRQGWSDVAKGPADRALAWANERTCDVCKLFGSPLVGSRISIGDGRLPSGADPIISVRDGVVIDRDAGSARAGLKYDFEVTSAGSTFETEIVVDDPLDQDAALLGAALLEWADGFTIGGATSRGLGRARAETTWLGQIDLSLPNDRRRFLLKKGDERWNAIAAPEAHFQAVIEKQLAAAEATLADRR